jgi:hypothetical protein
LANAEQTAALQTSENQSTTCHLYASDQRSRNQRNLKMKILIPLFLYALLSMPPGLFLLFRASITNKWSKAKVLWIVVLLGGPPGLFFAIYLNQYWDKLSFKSDVAYVQELCAKDGGDKIFRVVDNVEGIYQIKPRAEVKDADWRDQYGLPDPWGLAEFDAISTRNNNGLRGAIPLGKDSMGAGRHGYWFLEQNVDMQIGPPYQRRIDHEKETLIVKNLLSRYGYLSEDISTPEMRRRWIAGGRTTIIDLQTKEVLAIRTGYFRALGMRSPMHWQGAGMDGTLRACPGKIGLDNFLLAVLKPPNRIPSSYEISLIKLQD